jgi:hypothetical protein
MANEVPVLRLFQKMLMKFPIQRDISAQEACHLLAGQSLVISSFKVITINLLSTQIVQMPFSNENGHLSDDLPVVDSFSTIDKYISRRGIQQDEFDSWSMRKLHTDAILMTKSEIRSANIQSTAGIFYWRQLDLRRTKTRVLRPIPNPVPDLSNPEWCMVFLYLNFPFRSITELCGPNSIKTPDWVQRLNNL